jgi:hypothetical protein
MVEKGHRESPPGRPVPWAADAAARETPPLLAFAGDWHGNLTWALDVLDALAARGVREVVHCGDFGVWPGDRDYLRRLNARLRSRRQRLVVVDGNHEDHDRLAALRRDSTGFARLTARIAHAGRGARWEFHGARLAAFGGAVSVDRGPGSRYWWPGEAATEADLARLAAGGPADVLVCHDRPAGAPLPALAATRHFWPVDRLDASDAHRLLVQRAVDAVTPAVVLHGHYHDLPGYAGEDATHAMAHGPVRVVGLDRDGTTIGRNTWIATSDDLRGLR